MDQRPLRREAHKIFALHCSDGQMLLGFSGLAGIDPQCNELSDWVLQSSRGVNRTVEDTVVLLVNRLERDIHADWRTEQLNLAGVAFVGGSGGWTNPNASRFVGEAVLYHISNVDRSRDGILSVSALEVRKKVISQPAVLMHGSGVDLIEDADKDRLQLVAEKHPLRPEDVLGLLGGLIRKVSAKDERREVSPYSDGWYMPATGEPITWNQLRSSEDPLAPNAPSPFLLFGIDLTHAARVFSDAANAYWDGSISIEDFEAKTELGFRRAIEGRQ